MKPLYVLHKLLPYRVDIGRAMMKPEVIQAVIPEPLQVRFQVARFTNTDALTGFIEVTVFEFFDDAVMNTEF